MDHLSFWLSDYPRPPHLPTAPELPSRVDVAIVGGGYTGLSAARKLRQNGASVAVLESRTIGWGASSRNGGITGCGLKKGAPAIFKRYGEALGKKFWQLSLDALNLVQNLISEESIECNWSQKGDLCVAYKPSHYEGFKERIAWHKKNLGHHLELVPPERLQEEIGSPAYFGGVIDPHGTGLHPAKLVFGLAEAAARRGAHLCEHAAVTHLRKREGGGFDIHTRRGVLRADHVLLATNGYTDATFRRLRPKVLPVGSYSIVTEPLPPEIQHSISPKGRVFWDSKWFLNYFRLTPDGRLLWGGRNNLSTTLNLDDSARILQAQMIRAFPQAAGFRITHSWSGQLGVTFDLMPNIGRLEHGLYYALGYGGHGLHTALYCGYEAARLISGEIASSPLMEIPHTTYFFYRNRTWFLPFAAAYYRLRDTLS